MDFGWSITLLLKETEHELQEESRINHHVQNHANAANKNVHITPLEIDLIFTY